MVLTTAGFAQQLVGTAPEALLEQEFSDKQLQDVERFIDIANRNPSSASLRERYRYARIEDRGNAPLADLQLGMYGTIEVPYINQPELYALGQVLAEQDTDGLFAFAGSDDFEKLPDFTQEHTLRVLKVSAAADGLEREEIAQLYTLSPRLLEPEAEAWAESIGLSVPMTKELLELYQDIWTIARGTSDGPAPIISPPETLPGVSAGADPIGWFQVCSAGDNQSRPKDCPKSSSGEEQYLQQLQHRVSRREPDQALRYLSDIVAQQLPQQLKDDYTCWSDGTSTLLPRVGKVSVSNKQPTDGLNLGELSFDVSFVCGLFPGAPRSGATVQVGRVDVVYRYITSNQLVVRGQCQVSAHSVQVFVPEILQQLSRGLLVAKAADISINWLPATTEPTPEEDQFCDTVLHWTNDALLAEIIP